jgi:hypothetical protein
LFPGIKGRVKARKAAKDVNLSRIGKKKDLFGGRNVL